MTQLSKEDKVKNIFAFLALLFGEEVPVDALMNFSPDYLIEKWDRYMESTRPEYDRGLHPTLRRGVFDKYCEKWKLNEN